MRPIFSRLTLPIGYRPILALLAGVILLLGTGCGRVKDVYLLDPAVLTWPNLKGLDHVAYTTGALELRGKRIEVELLDPRQTLDPGSPGQNNPSWDWDEWHTVVEAAIADALYQSRIFSDVAARNDPGPMQDPDLELVVALTEWNPGNRWLRYFFGFGLGRTRMQMEAKLRVASTGRLPVVIADAREHPGGPSTFPIGFKALRTQVLLKEDLNGLLIDMQKALCEVSGTPYAPLDRSMTHLKYHPRLGPAMPAAPAAASPLAPQP